MLLISLFFPRSGKPITLSPPTEEVAGFYAKMLNHDYTTMDVFNKNFLKDWRKVMTPKEQEHIKDLKKCDFRPMNTYFTEKSEERKNRSKEEKQVSYFILWCSNVQSCRAQCTAPFITALVGSCTPYNCCKQA